MGSEDPLYAPLPLSTRGVVGGPSSLTTHYDITTFVHKLCPQNKQEIEEGFPKHVFIMTCQSKKSCKPRGKKGLLSLKERRELGMYKLRRNNMKYEHFLPLHTLWKEYFTEYINIDALKKQGFRGKPEDRQWDNVSRMLLKADYHGSILTVKKSRCYSVIGKTGIVVFDTKNTFQLLGQDNVLRIIPKEASVFTLSFRHFIFTILGNQFCIKPAARNSKKIKTLISVEL